MKDSSFHTVLGNAACDHFGAIDALRNMQKTGGGPHVKVPESEDGDDHARRGPAFAVGAVKNKG